MERIKACIIDIFDVDVKRPEMGEDMLNSENICAVIVSYNAGTGIKDCIKGIANQVNHIVIVDNYSNNETLNALKETEKIRNADVIYNDSNYGIAKALNIGIKKAMECGYKWVITLDHDSIASSNMIEEMARVYNLVEDKQSIGIICPRLYDVNKQGFLINDDKDAEPYRELKVAIQSGSLIKTDIFAKFGFFNEALFIYYVDVEFSVRLKQKNLKIIQCNKAVLYHEEGKKLEKRLLSKVYYYDNYSETAVYYIARNSIYMIKNYSENRISYIRRLRSDFIKILIFDYKPIIKLLYYLHGILDGFRNKYGMYR